MKPLFVRIKCELGMTIAVGETIMDTIEETAVVYSIAGKYDLLVKFNLQMDQSIGRFVHEKLHHLKGVRRTNTLIVFNAFTQDAERILVETK